MHSKGNVESKYLRKQSCPGTVDSVERCFSQASKLFEICQNPPFASLLPERCVKSGHVMALSPTRRCRETQEGPETVHRCHPIPTDRPPRPFADLIYGAILMPKNIPCAPSVCPASRFQAVSGLSRSSRSRFFVLYRSFARFRPC